MKEQYKALISSDWNECLSPSTPFEPICFHYPNLKNKLNYIFTLYTSNKITYSSALEEIKKIMPKSFCKEHMDKYLTSSFSLYRGVREFIEWCRANAILFMINTTGWVGYFQRAMKLNLMPHVNIISANPFLKFKDKFSNVYFMDLYETEDKGKNTEIIAKRFGITNIFLIGDSGGDGPHFLWGKKNNAILIGCMTKPSLVNFCNNNNIKIDYYVGDCTKPHQGIDANLLISIIMNKALH